MLFKCPVVPIFWETSEAWGSHPIFKNNINPHAYERNYRFPEPRKSTFGFRS